MTTFCLLHSSGQDARGWKLLIEQLAILGHDTLTPNFHIDATDCGATWHAAALMEQLDRVQARPSDVVCVAHSAAGMFLPLLAEMWHPRQMIFLAALVPWPGRSIRDQFRADPTMFQPEWVGKDPMNDEVALEFLYHDCPQDRLEWVLSTRVTFYARRAMEEACPLDRWPTTPAAYIVCTEDRTLSPAWQRRAARELVGVNPTEFPGGHCPHVSRPAELAGVLSACAL